MARFISKLEPSTGLYVVLEESGETRIPVGRSHDSRIRAEEIAALLSRDWAALLFAGVELPVQEVTGKAAESSEEDSAFEAKVADTMRAHMGAYEPPPHCFTGDISADIMSVIKLHRSGMTTDQYIDRMNRLRSHYAIGAREFASKVTDALLKMSVLAS